MSKKHNEVCNYDYKERPGCGGGFGLGNLTSGCCSFSCLVILILIILQFGKKRHGDGDGFKQVDNGILFIIALFYLSCCSPCR